MTRFSATSASRQISTPRRSAAFLSLAACLLVAMPATAEPGSTGTTPVKVRTVDFLRDIKPILSNNCFACHGPDEKARKARLRLDIPEEAYKAAKSGERPIVPGRAAASESFKRLLSNDADAVMPPPATNHRLTPPQIETVRTWIDEGAVYDSHWSFDRPVKAPLPVVKNAEWAKTPIDRFVLARLEKAGLKPSPEAGRETLIRRVSLDLRGIPPTVAEIDEYLSDAAPGAYDRLVDRMLASPAFGEKQTQVWLDLARFGDTSGYHQDSTRQMWLWRDWVIDAFNRNLPYSQFTVEQLAGDLLPNATQAQKIASGFNRNTRFNEEGGADPEEFVIRYNIDRTNTLGQVWLGMTLGCAECHTHKYDPISHKEYYSLYAFFTGIKEPHTSGNHGQSLPPLMRVSTPEIDKRLVDLRARHADLTKKIADELKGMKYAEPEPAALNKPAEPTDIVWIEDDLPKGAVAQGDGPEPWKWVVAPGQPVYKGSRANVREGRGNTQHYFTGATDMLTIGSEKDKLFAWAWTDPKNPPTTLMLQFNNGTWEHRAYFGEDKCYLAGSPDADNHRKTGALPKPGVWTRLEVVAGAVGLKAGDKLNGWAFTQAEGRVIWDHAGITSVPADQRPKRSFNVWLETAKGDKKLPGPVVEAFRVEATKRTEAHKTTLKNHWLEYEYVDGVAKFAPLKTELGGLTARIKTLDESVPTTMVTEEMDKPRDAFILIRGDFLQKGDKVDRAVPAVFPPIKPTGKDGKPTRLDLANWLVSGDHPLTARVTVNRFWAQLFGTGIVKSLGDFGTQGEAPSHPELLDYLAVDFVESGWDVKAAFRRMVLSATYRQSSVFDRTPETDPYNRLLYRAPRFRLGAEDLRDNALKIAGILSPRVGGPSFMPYQPGDFYKGKNEGWAWTTAGEEDLYRRGIYGFWRRTSLHPMFAIFDAPSREECAASRPRTNTALQALVTLNDPTFTEAARVFAQKILSDVTVKTFEERSTLAFRTAMGRKPSPGELAALRKRYEYLLAKYKADGASAGQIVKVGRYPQPTGVDVAEHATWTGICNILLNLDETITRE